MSLVVILAAMFGVFVLRRKAPHLMKTDRERAEDELRSGARKAVDGAFDLESRLPDLREYVRVASGVLSEADVRRPPVASLPSIDGSHLDFAKRAILLAVSRFGMTPPVLKVRFATLGSNHAGSVREDRGTWLVDLDQTLQTDFDALLAAAAHEVAHVALLHRRIGVQPIQRNEELTDAAAVLAGFGPVLVHAVYRERLSDNGNELRLDWRRLGYLPPRALVYLSSMRVEMAGGDATFYRDHVPDWQRQTVDTYVRLRDEWVDVARTARGGRVNCFACATAMRLPATAAAVRVICRTCRFPVVIPSRFNERQPNATI